MRRHVTGERGKYGAGHGLERCVGRMCIWGCKFSLMRKSLRCGV